VYADPYDTMLGIGLDMNSPDVSKRDKWQGRNVLGNILTEIRDELLSKLQVCSNYIAIIQAVVGIYTLCPRKNCTPV